MFWATVVHDDHKAFCCSRLANAIAYPRLEDNLIACGYDA